MASASCWSGRRRSFESRLGNKAEGLGIEIVNATQVVEMDEHPANAVRQKPDSSMVVGVRQVREGKAQAFVSAGNTGAVMAAGLFELRRIRGVDRPALAGVFPTRKGGTLVIDIGANADAKPEYLAQFALMGSAYMQGVFGIERPKVGLLSNGEEETKGSALVQAAHPRLRELPINFVGNVEGKEIPSGDVDVVVCDGFTGNVVLKLAEGLAGAITGMIREEISSSVVSKLFAVGHPAGLPTRAQAPGLRRVRRRAAARPERRLHRGARPLECVGDQERGARGGPGRRERRRRHDLARARRGGTTASRS